MDSRTRMLTAFAFREPDRVPIELHIDPRVRGLPEADKLVRFIGDEADNFHGIQAMHWGFLGLPGHQSEEVIEDLPGDYRRVRRTWETPAGPFRAITRHNYPHLDSPDYRWERRYIHTLEDMVRLAEAPRQAPRFDRSEWDDHVGNVGTRGLPVLGLMHPLGWLVRSAKMEEVYAWLLSEGKTIRRFLEEANAQVIGAVEAVGRAGVKPWFGITAHEMLIPPWMGMRHFDEWVFPYDKAVNDTIHRIGGKLRSHCHGNCMHFLERMADMGIDAIEPLEPPPFGDVNLGEAKRRVGSRMVLSGNIPSQDFYRLQAGEVRRMVRETIAAAAPGGGFTLRTTGGHAGVSADLDRETLRKIITNVEAYVEAGLEYGRYPIAG